MDQNPEFAPVIISFLKLIESKGRTITHFKILENVIKPGNNFCSSIARLQIEYKNVKNKSLKNKTVLVKIPSGGVLYDQFKRSTFYLNEVLMYKVVFPEMNKWTKKEFSAKCFYLSDTNDLVLEDLNASGFYVKERKSQLDFEHAKMVLKKLALFHVLSVKLYEIAPRKMKVIKQLDGTKVGPVIKEMMELMFEKFINTLQAISVSSVTIKKIREFKRDRMWEEISTKKVRVLCHGDLHLQNVLFKYDVHGKVSDARFIDFQVSRKGSPVSDLIYFFVGSVQVDVFIEHHEFLFQYYLHCFQKNFALLKCKPKYDQNDFQEDLESHKLYYLRILGMILGMIMTDGTEKVGNAEQNNEQAFTSDSYRDSIRKWMNFLLQKNMI